MSTFNMSNHESMNLQTRGEKYALPRNTYISFMRPLLNSFDNKIWYTIKNISMRYSPGRKVVLNILRHMSYNLVIESKKEHQVGASEDYSFKENELFIPFSIMKEELRHRHDEYQTVSLVLPKAFRIIFYSGFFVMLGIGIIMSRIAIGANNICIYFDEPPCAYFSAAIWVVLINVLFYQISDMVRTHDAYCDGHISKKFYRDYKITSGIETTINIYFTQSLTVKPDESMIDARFSIAMERFLHFKVTGITDHRPIQMCILGIIYIILLLYYQIYLMHIGGKWIDENEQVIALQLMNHYFHFGFNLSVLH